MKNEQENKNLQELKSGTSGSFLGIIGNTARGHTKDIIVGYR